MTDEPIDLDDRRTGAGKIAADIRRHSLHEFEAARDSLRRRQEERRAQFLAIPPRPGPRRPPRRST